MFSYSFKICYFNESYNFFCIARQIQLVTEPNTIIQSRGLGVSQQQTLAAHGQKITSLTARIPAIPDSFLIANGNNHVANSPLILFLME